MESLDDMTAATMTRSAHTSLEDIEAAIEKAKHAPMKLHIRVVSPQEYGVWKRFYKVEAPDGPA